MGMKRYIIKRVLQAFLVIFIVATLVFLAVRAIPGSPVRVLLGGQASPSAIRTLRQQLALNQPIYIQYYAWLTKIAHGNLGKSIYANKPVLSLLIDASKPTVTIGLLGMLIALLIAIPAGIISAVYQDSLADYVATITSFLGISMPAFYIGILLILLFAGHLNLLPAFGYVPPSEGFIPWLKHIILPTLAVGLPYGGLLMRMTRSSMLEVLNEHYIRTARAKGLSGRIILFKHGLQNALIPIVTMAGLYLGLVLGGAVTVEIVFGYNGLGRLLIRSVMRRDFPVIQGAVILISFIFVFMNLFVDLLYTAINPKIKYGGSE